VVLRSDRRARSLTVAVRMLYLILRQVMAWFGLLARNSRSKNAENLVLRLTWPRYVARFADPDCRGQIERCSQR
jgi:hypothetical protein